MCYVSGTQASPRQHENDRPVTKPTEVWTITGGDQAYHVFCGQTLRQPGKPPVSDGGDREGQIISRFATEVEITQKCPEGCNQLLCGRSSTLAGPFEKKVAYGLRRPLADIFAERLKQVRSTAGVLPKSGLLHPAVPLKPVTEGANERGIRGRIPNRFTQADPAPDKVSMEKFHSKNRVVAYLSSLEMRASATAKMTTKAIKHVEIDVCQTAASPMNEAAEMGSGTNVSHGAGRGISVAFEVLCKRIDVWSTDSIPQAPQRFRRREVCL
jgi:hypothetical protein